MRPGNPRREIHLSVGLLATVIAITAAFVYAYALRGRAGWEWYWQYSLLTGVLVLAVMPVFFSAQASAGLWQRVLVGIILVWEEVMALRLSIIWKGRE